MPFHAEKPLDRHFCERNTEWLPVHDCPRYVLASRLPKPAPVICVKPGTLDMHLWCVDNCTGLWTSFGAEFGGWDDGFGFELDRDAALFRTFFADFVTCVLN
jgi:hypothetical protein